MILDKSEEKELSADIGVATRKILDLESFRSKIKWKKKKIKKQQNFIKKTKL